jgi:hypothetical protein
MPRLVHDPHSPTPDLGQDLVLANEPRDRENHPISACVCAPVSVPDSLPPAERTNRRTALCPADERFFAVRGALLKPNQQRIGGSQFIDALAALGTIAEVGRDASYLCVPEPAQRKSAQLLVRGVV